MCTKSVNPLLKGSRSDKMSSPEENPMFKTHSVKKLKAHKKLKASMSEEREKMKAREEEHEKMKASMDKMSEEAQTEWMEKQRNQMNKNKLFRLIKLVAAKPVQTDGFDAPFQNLEEDGMKRTQMKLNTMEQIILLVEELRDSRLVAAQRLMSMYSRWIKEKGFTLSERTVEASLVIILLEKGPKRKIRMLDIGEVQPFKERSLLDIVQPLNEHKPVKFATHVGIVSVQSCQSLRDAIDEKIPGSVCGDTKQDWTEKEAKQHITPEEWLDVQKLLEFHGFSAFSEYTIKARRWTCDPEQPNDGINVHLDHHAKVLQLALNKDFEGGELFYQDDQRKCTPRREVGMCIIHDNTVAHGVTPVTSGGRYALYFLVDEKNRVKTK